MSELIISQVNFMPGYGFWFPMPSLDEDKNES